MDCNASEIAKPVIYVTVHYCGWQGDWGASTKWQEYHVYAGRRPFGPRGGRNCRVTAGRWIEGRFRKRSDAEEWACAYAQQHGYVYIDDVSNALSARSGTETTEQVAA